MNRQDFQDLADLRIKEAGVLLAGGCWAGAYYLGGYSVECALKACIAKRTKEYDFPDKSQVNRSHTHDLRTLLDLAVLVDARKTESLADAEFDNNWTTVCDWSEDSRYNIGIDEPHARQLIAAVEDPTHGSLAMAEEMVVKEYLSESMLALGREVMNLLDRAQLPLDGVAWFYFPEGNYWRLMVVSPLVRQIGPKGVYGRIQAELRKPGSPQIELSDITARDPTEPPANLLRKAIRTPPGYMADVRIKGWGIDGQYVDDAYIYRLQ